MGYLQIHTWHNFVLHDPNITHDALKHGGLKQTCGINQPCGQYRTQKSTADNRICNGSGTENAPF